MAKKVALTDAEYVAIGRRYGSADVATEANEVATRWARDVAILADYGFGAEPLAAYNAERAAHAAMREKRPEIVAQKTVSVGARDAAVTAAWVWVDKVTSLLGTLARKDPELAARLTEATPLEDSGLDTGIGALKKLVEAKSSALPRDSNAAARVAEAEGLASAVKSTAGAAAVAKAAPVTDTAELDRYDGKLYVVIKDLNAAGRKAIRNGLLKAKRSEYTFNQLQRSAEKADPKPDPKAVPAT